MMPPRIAALAGGVGGAKLAAGLQSAVAPGELAVVVNTADDVSLFGLRISPDVDTVMYTLAGLADPGTGWGVHGDTWQVMEMLQRYGRDTWFRLGDRDLGTHILRTQMLREGNTLTQATANLAFALGIPSAIFPMTNEPVATIVETADGPLDFQDYFVRRAHGDEVKAVKFRGVESARPTPEALAAIAGAETIMVCPSNPIVSVGPILALPGMRAAIEGSQATKVAVSPIVGGAALKGPAAEMLRTLGHEVSAAGVAAIYRGLIHGIVIDEVDRELAPRIEAMGIAVKVANTIMKDAGSRQALAEVALRFANDLRPQVTRGAG